MGVVLLTGGAGYVGSHAAKYLATCGFQPVVYDNLGRGHRSAVKWGPCETGDIGDGHRIAEVLEKYRPEAGMHFAAIANVGESVQSPELYYRNNVTGTLVLLEAMLKAGVKRMIFSSTCATYGVPSIVPITEDMPQNPINPYGNGKLMVERILADLERAHGLRSVSLRYFNAAGADPEVEIGENHDPETHLIPLILDVALEKRKYISIYGKDYPTPDGTCIRDYVHVTDLAQAHFLAFKHQLAGGDGIQANLGNGDGYSVLEVIEATRKVTGKPIPIEYAPRRPGDPAILVGSSEKAKNIFGWKPEFGSLPAILETAWNWHKKLRNT